MKRGSQCSGGRASEAPPARPRQPWPGRARSFHPVSPGTHTELALKVAGSPANCVPVLPASLEENSLCDYLFEGVVPCS